MKFGKLMVVAAVAASSLGLAGTAVAAPTKPPTTAQVIGPVVVDRHDRTVGYLTAVYRCYGEGELWVSVKQVEDRSKDPRLQEEGSSGISAAWSMSHRNSVNCDGRLHVQVFKVDQVETAGFGIPPAPLKLGWGYVQFCLFDDNYPATGDDPSTLMPFINDGFHLVL